VNDLLPVTTHEMIVELEREIALRRHVYPRWVADKRLSQDKADRQIAVLEAVVGRLRGGDA
jgi:hypothetical protein